MGLLLGSLQRLYSSKDNATEPPRSAPVESPPPKSSSQPPYNAAVNLLETVFDISELDPLPFIDRRYAQVAADRSSNRPASAAAVSVDTQPSPKHVVEAGSPPAPTPVAPVAADRRKMPRRESDCAVMVCPYTSRERLTPEKIAWLLHAAKLRGHLEDVSMSGLALSLSDQVVPGTKVALRISGRVLDKHVDATATVLRCRQEGETTWSVVCRFDKNLTFEQIHLIGRNLFASTIV